MPVNVLILRAPGTNCDRETAHAFQQVNGWTEILHINRVLENPARLSRYQILCLPGGFSYGDDIAAGRIVAGQIRHHLADQLQSFRDAGNLILGICNGFQILLKSGLVVSEDPNAGPQATLTWNDSGRFEARWVRLRVASDACVFLRDIGELELPIAHAEGRFVARDDTVLRQLDAAGQLVLRYAAPGLGQPAPEAPLPFPLNPNGSQANVAGVCDRTGRVLGLMPHPERHVEFTQHPHWTRRGMRHAIERFLPHEIEGDGLKLFRNAVEYFR